MKDQREKDRREKDSRERDPREKPRAPILAAGGVVVRGSEPLVAVVQLRKCDSWVLPKGKLNADESALAAARREVLEEVGFKVHIHEFLGTMSYDVGERVKVVQFWRMRAVGEPARRLTHDVKAVQWLPLPEAIDKLTRSREQTFLENVAPVVTKTFARTARKALPADEPAHKNPPAERFVQKRLPEAIEQSAIEDDHEVMPPPPPRPADGVRAPEPSPRDHIVETVRAWFRRGRGRRAA
jgi:8-oxo-dGTP diphosphatase